MLLSRNGTKTWRYMIFAYDVMHSVRCSDACSRHTNYSGLSFQQYKSIYILDVHDGISWPVLLLHFIREENYFSIVKKVPYTDYKPQACVHGCRNSNFSDVLKLSVKFESLWTLMSVIIAKTTDYTACNLYISTPDSECNLMGCKIFKMLHENNLQFS